MRIGVLTKHSFRSQVAAALSGLADTGVEFAILPGHDMLRHEPAQYSAVLSLQYDRIIDRVTLETLRRADVPVLNLHHSLLPKYRGMYPIAHALLCGETETGITYHLVDEGIDTGPIVRQFRFPIDGHATARNIYGRCVELFEQTIGEIVREMKRGTITDKIVRQDNARASYFSARSLDFANDSVLTCQDGTADLWRKFRAFYFPQYQRPKLLWYGPPLELDEIIPVFAHGSRRPGRVLGTGDRGVQVDTLDGSIEIAAIMENGVRVSDPERILSRLHSPPHNDGVTRHSFCTNSRG